MNSWWRYRLLWLTFTGLMLPTTAVADADPLALSPEQLFDAEVISASRSLQSVWDSAGAVYVVTAGDIERAGVTSIPEALRLVPGVQVARINGSGWAISMRGFNAALANKLLVLIDGRETYDPLFSGVYWDVQDTVIEDIERIEVIRGPGASLWGANAVNGVVNIITRPAADTQGVLASAIIGEGEQVALTLRYGASIGEQLHWRVYGRAFERDGEERLAGGDDHSDWQAWRGGWRFDTELGPRDAITLQGDLYRSETGQYRQVPSFSAPFTALEREAITAEGVNVLGRWTHSREDGARLTMQVYIDLTRRDQRLLEDSRSTADLDVQYEWPALGAHDVITGVRYRSTSDEITQTDAIRSGDDSHRSELLSAFVQDQIVLAPSWRLTLGSKFDENDYTGFEVQPNARLRWTGEGQMAWGAISRAVRSPSELDREFNILLAAGPPFPMMTLPVTIELLPSPEFESEQVTAFELGYRRQIMPGLALDVAIFHNDYEGLATLTPQAPQIAADPPRLILVPITMTNASKGRAQGGEAVLDWRVRDDLNVSLTYSYLDIEIEAPATAINGDVAEGQSPHHQGNVRVQWDATDHLAVDAVLYYVDNLPALDVDAYVRADLRVGVRLTDALQLDLIGRNLTDDGHREFTAPSDANAAEIGRSIFGRLTWRR